MVDIAQTDKWALLPELAALAIEHTLNYCPEFLILRYPGLCILCRIRIALSPTRLVKTRDRQRSMVDARS